MKFFTIVLICVFFIPTLFAADIPKSKCSPVYFKDISIDFDNDDLIISPRSGENFTVKITKDDELYVNGQLISMTAEEKELVHEYRYDLICLIHEAKEIGLKGAKIGISAIGGLIEVACTDLEMEELEAELENESEKIEMEAKELEELSSRLEELHCELKNRIPELEDLPTFEPDN